MQKQILVKLFYHFRYRLSNTEKIIYLLLSAFFIVKLIELIVENKKLVGIFIGIIMLITGIYLYLKNKTYIKKYHVLNDFEDKKKLTTNYDINTNGGNYNRLIEGDYIQGDYINIQDNRVDISKDVTEIFDDFRSILTEMQNQGYSTEQAVSQVAKELASETRNKPYVKDKLHIEENADDIQIYEELINLLSINKPLLNQKQYFQVDLDDENSEEIISYKGYTIHLEPDKDDNWYYKIDGLLFGEETGKSYLKYDAIDEAKGKIDEERFSNW